MTLAIMNDNFGRKWRLVFDDPKWAKGFAKKMDLDVVSLKEISIEEADNIVEIEY